jgi:hypothetical protein
MTTCLSCHLMMKSYATAAGLSHDDRPRSRSCQVPPPLDACSFTHNNAFAMPNVTRPTCPNTKLPKKLIVARPTGATG